MEPGHEGLRDGRPRPEGTTAMNGTIDRPLLSALIFHDQNALETMNGIIHPMVWKTIKDKICSSQADLIVVESAIMGGNRDVSTMKCGMFIHREERIVSGAPERKRGLQQRAFPKHYERSAVG